MNGPTNGFDAWFNWGSFVTGAGNRSHPVLELGEGDWQAAVTPSVVGVSMLYVENIKEEVRAF